MVYTFSEDWLLRHLTFVRLILYDIPLDLRCGKRTFPTCSLWSTACLTQDPSERCFIASLYHDLIHHHWRRIQVTRQFLSRCVLGLLLPDCESMLLLFGDIFSNVNEGTWIGYSPHKGTIIRKVQVSFFALSNTFPDPSTLDLTRHGLSLQSPSVV